VAAGLALAAASAAKLLPAAPDKFTYDWRTFFLTERADHARDDIAIVLIDEKSLEGYNYISPIDRGLIAELVKAVDASAPKAIGLDLIFDRRTETQKDDALAEALRAARAPVILGALDGRQGEAQSNLAFQEKFISRTGRPAGHLVFGAEKNRLTLGDQAVRFLLPPSAQPPRRAAFARLLAEVDGKKPEPASSLIYWRQPLAADGSDLFPTFFVPTHKDETGATKAVLPEAWRSALTGKIVLIGGAFADRDLHLTPLTVASQRPRHGVEIHAQVLAQLRDGRSMHETPFWAEFLLAAVITGAGILAARRWTLSGSGVISTAIAFFAIVAAGALTFWATHVVLPSATLFLAWAAGLFAGNWADTAELRLHRVLGHKSLSTSGG
jgi:CHASE2 domain-containing sensor protein